MLFDKTWKSSGRRGGNMVTIYDLHEMQEQLQEAMKRIADLEEELKAYQEIPTMAPCPFCGIDESALTVEGAEEFEWVTCQQCMASGPLTTEGPIAAWNTRLLVPVAFATAVEEEDMEDEDSPSEKYAEGEF